MYFKTSFLTYAGLYRTIETSKLNCPTVDGRRTILSNHMPIIMPLSIGVLETEEKGEIKHYAINAGVLYFHDNEAIIVTDDVYLTTEINEEKAIKDLKQAQLILDTSTRESEIMRAKVDVARQTNLLNVLKESRK